MTHHSPALFSTPADDQRPHAIVIGAGFGGLAAAARLGARGYRVTVLERLEQPGGRARRFRQDGFTFDAGPTIVTAPFVFEELWQACGKDLHDDVKLVSLDPFYTIRYACGETFRPSADTNWMRSEIARLNPSDVDGYSRYLEESERCFEAGFVKLIDTPVGTIPKLLSIMPVLARRRADRSVFKLVSKYVQDHRLRVALSFHPLFIGGNPLRTTAIMSLISYLEKEYGVHYAMGGTHALVEGIVNLIEDQGGQVVTHASVDEILTENGTATGVRLDSSIEIKSDIVVSNADAGWTYAHLLRKNGVRRWTAKRLGRAKHSMSLFVWYFGTDRKYDSVDHHTILMGPRYESLLTDIFDRKILAEDFSLYLYRPTKTDPCMAPDGCDSFYVLSPVPNMESGIDWLTAAEPYRQRLQSYLEATVLPELGQHVVTSRLMTPPDFQNDLLSLKGAAFGMEPVLFQLAWFRPHNRSEELKNLYMTGAGTHPGAGLPGVVSSAKILDTVVPHASQLS
ncbi:MAG: phytoene desaturase [Roseibium sp.]|nr:phytoene desaturase [Roseibium sp.]